MIASGQLARLEEVARGCGSVLDVGGWYRPFNLATHVLDLCPYDTRRRHDALDPHDAERFSADTWTIRDICDTPWPYADRQFDFAFCSHTLEDVRDPVAVCRELARVARAGYVEVPSRAREIFVKKRLSRLRGLLGRASEVGFRHHRWFCE
ncbi:MAG: methyltransferase domain-containing protein, partial [Alphaproteobacteria bacterium]|nr:methyltransferase domain-containing protein [Alphaproteobacteria bacterium]